MAKLFDVSEENRDLIDVVFQETKLHNVINLVIRGKAKDNHGKILWLQRAGDIAEDFGKCPGTVVCFVYEEAFDRLDEDTKRMLVKDVIATLSYDYDKDKIVIGCPQIIITVAGRREYGEVLLNAYETGLMAIAQIEDEKKEEKERLKERKAGKKNN